MMRKRTTNKKAEETIEETVETKVTQMKQKLLKKPHTHAGTQYQVGTPLETLQASDSAVKYMSENGII